METRKKQSSIINATLAEPPNPPPIHIENTDCLGERSHKRYYTDQYFTTKQKEIDATFKQCEINANREYAYALHSCIITGVPCTKEELKEYEDTFLNMLWQCGIDKEKAETNNYKIWGSNWKRIDLEYASCCAANPGPEHGCGEDIPL